MEHLFRNVSVVSSNCEIPWKSSSAQRFNLPFMPFARYRYTMQIFVCLKLHDPHRRLPAESNVFIPLQSSQCTNSFQLLPYRLYKLDLTVFKTNSNLHSALVNHSIRACNKTGLLKRGSCCIDYALQLFCLIELPGCVLY